MNKQVIETLIELTNNEITFNQRRVQNLPEIHNIIHLKSCIDQLQKLKEFEFPDNGEIETLSKSRFPDLENQMNERFRNCWIDGGIFIREQLKQKLS